MKKKSVFVCVRKKRPASGEKTFFFFNDSGKNIVYIVGKIYDIFIKKYYNNF
jgi:S-adenosylmethionine synthetase